MGKKDFIQLIRDKLENYRPKAVKRVYIPKQNGDKRPLGIPCMIDRLIQQMFKQILEPICEAKFYKHSYGFRPFRSTQHALARCSFLINMNHLHYVVDIDIKSFFDNVNHSLLLKQIWNLGIQDRKVLAIIFKMLKAPIDKGGLPTKGTPQGGILSPLFSNVVLNDIDQWISNQWETFETKYPYSRNDNKCNVLKSSNLKEGYIVRYADDFKVFARDYKTAYKWYHAVRLYLKDRLKLEISPEKSKVINLRKSYSEFLGFKLKAVAKGKKIVAYSFIKDKKKDQIKEKARSIIKAIRKEPTAQNILKWNSFVLGVHNYFKYATHVNIEFKRIAYDLSRTMFNRFNSIGNYTLPNAPPPCYKKFYGKNKFKAWIIGAIYLYPIADIQHSISYVFYQEVTPYSEKGRQLIHRGSGSIHASRGKVDSI